MRTLGLNTVRRQRLRTCES